MNGTIEQAAFDSCVIIDFLSGSLTARSLFNRVQSKHLSVVSRAEILVGARTNEDVILLQDALTEFNHWPVTSDIADRAAKYRRDHKLKLPDAFILATADIRGIPLITRDSQLITMGKNIISYVV